ncbi:MAG: cyclase family protein, partial [Candidatus Binatia bacterium]
MRLAAVVMTLFPLLPVAANAESTARIIDLTHAFDAKTIFWPTEKGFELEAEHAGVTEQGYYYAANRFCTAEHGGTHVDAPRHFAESGQTVDEIPLERLVGPAVTVDVTERAAKERDYRIGVEDLRAFEKRHGEIPRRSIVLLRTGFGALWPDRERYLGTAERGGEAVARLHFPGLHPEAARWLVAEREARAVGIDTASIDYGQSKLFETHVVLSARNVPAF